MMTVVVAAAVVMMMMVAVASDGNCYKLFASVDFIVDCLRPLKNHFASVKQFILFDSCN